MPAIKSVLTVFFTLLAFAIHAQQKDTTDLMTSLENDATKNVTVYTKATFKTTRLVNGHSVENLGRGVLDVKISHRFGTLNKGGYELFGLDNATMRMGLDYGITDKLMIGIGRSTYQKTFDAFFKIKLLQQSTGKIEMPITLNYVSTIALNSLHWENPANKNYFRDRLYYVHQLIIGRKFSENTSLQLMPSFIHRNIVPLQSDPNNSWAIGIGGRQKLSKRISFNAEYYYQLPATKLNGTSNVLSLGFDIETGGHVFQLHFTNSQGMTEKTFIGETTGKWQKGDVLFGFNIARVFNIGKHH